MVREREGALCKDIQRRDTKFKTICETQANGQESVSKKEIKDNSAVELYDCLPCCSRVRRKTSAPPVTRLAYVVVV